MHIYERYIVLSCPAFPGLFLGETALFYFINITMSLGKAMNVFFEPVYHKVEPSSKEKTSISFKHSLVRIF